MTEHKFLFMFLPMYKQQGKQKNQFSILLLYFFFSFLLVLFYFYLDHKQKKKKNRTWTNDEIIIGSLREVLGWEFDSLLLINVGEKEKNERNINTVRDMYSSRRCGPVTDLHNAHTVSTLMRTMTTTSHHPHRHSSRSKTNLNGTLPFRSSSIHQVETRDRELDRLHRVHESDRAGDLFKLEAKLKGNEKVISHQNAQVNRQKIELISIFLYKFVLDWVFTRSQSWIRTTSSRTNRSQTWPNKQTIRRTIEKRWSSSWFERYR